MAYGVYAWLQFFLIGLVTVGLLRRALPRCAWRRWLVGRTARLALSCWQAMRHA